MGCYCTFESQRVKANFNGPSTSKNRKQPSLLPEPPSPQHGKEKGNELGYVLAMLLRDMALHLLFEFNLRLYGGCAMTDKLLIDRELLERVLREYERQVCTHEETYRGGSIWEICTMCNAKWADDEGGKPEFKWPKHIDDLRAILAAPRQPEGDAHKNEAQPEVAQNTGSRSMTNKLSSQGCTGCTGVEGAATPCETPDAVDIFAWATFDGEGSYDLRLYEDNEGYRDDFRDANPLLHPDWVFPLCRLSDHQRAIAELREECEHLKDCQENAMLHMTGLVSERDTLRQQLAERDAQIASMRAEVTPFIETHWRPVAEQRDRLAGLLQKARWYVATARYSDNDEGDFAARRQAVMLTDIDAALAEIEG